MERQTTGMATTSTLAGQELTQQGEHQYRHRECFTAPEQPPHERVVGARGHR
jgi:hypothetical protein